MPDQPTITPEPHGFADLPLQPTGSGVADEERAFVAATIEGGVSDEISSPDIADVPTQGGADEAESEAQPS